LLGIWGLAAVVTVLGFVLAYQYVDPAPPEHISIGTGGSHGAYYQFAQQYAERLAVDGVTLVVRETAGSAQNLGLLQTAGGAGVDVSFVQGGMTGREPPPGLVSLAALYFEPLWVFYRDALPVETLGDLAGRRLALGPVGSGTRVLAEQLLVANGVEATDTALLSAGGMEAAGALERGEVDAVFVVAGQRSAVVQRLLEAAHVLPLSFARADAYTGHFRFLSKLVLPRGAVDLARNLPAQDVVLLAPTANLVARSDLHPALVDLLLQVTHAVHGRGGVFEDPGEFPSARHVELPLSPEAQRYFRSGPPLLRRYLPFWAATWVERLKVMLVPFVALLIPLLRFTPPVYRWRVRSRIYRWYRLLLELETRLDHDRDPAAIDRYRRELDLLEQDVSRVTVPLSYADELYDLRFHIGLVRERVQRAAKVGTAAAGCGQGPNPGR